MKRNLNFIIKFIHSCNKDSIIRIRHIIRIKSRQQIIDEELVINMFFICNVQFMVIGELKFNSFNATIKL